MFSSNRARSILSTLVFAASVALSGCHGSSSSNSPSPPTPATRTVGGTVSGLASVKCVTLQNNGGDSLSQSANGSFTFATAVASGASYAVAVSTQPPRETSTVASSNVNTVAVSCVNVDETVLHSFANTPDGSNPTARLVRDAIGNLYGTTAFGGATGKGTVFKITQAGAESVLWSFGSSGDGAYPYADLVLDASDNLYGTTVNGGARNQGTVFKITPTGEESVLHSFAGGADGAEPTAGLVRDASGNLYGTTNEGGARNNGTVFKITPAGAESVVYSFAGGTDGANPTAGLVRDANGNLYGTTNSGGANGKGTIFKITPAGAESVVYSFAGGTDGANPTAGLVRDANGNLYGTTYFGGANGKGTVFKTTPAGAESVLWPFGSGADGANPHAGLVLDANGNLYGTTNGGGANGKGTIFKITPAGAESVLHSFAGGTDGANPHAGLVLDASGNLYGTTYNGGASGNGTVFRIMP